MMRNFFFWLRRWGKPGENPGKTRGKPGENQGKLGKTGENRGKPGKTGEYWGKPGKPRLVSPDGLTCLVY